MSTGTIADRTHDQFDYQAFGEPISFDAAAAKTIQLFAGDGEFDGASGLYYRDARWGREFSFTSYDSFEADPASPANVHKYAYTTGNPISFVDPTGHFDLLSVLAVSTIIGSIIGGSAGIAYAKVYKNASFFSAETLKDALIGAFAGGAIGAAVGSGAWTVSVVGWEGAGEILATGLRVYAMKAAGTHSTTLGAGIGGFLVGLVVGLIDPDLVVTITSAIATASLYVNQGLLEGVRRNSIQIGRGTVSEDIEAIAGFAETYGIKSALKGVAGGGFITLAFAAGFTIGYEAGASLRLLVDKARDE